MFVDMAVLVESQVIDGHKIWQIFFHNVTKWHIGKKYNNAWKWIVKKLGFYSNGLLQYAHMSSKLAFISTATHRYHFLCFYSDHKIEYNSLFERSHKNI